MIIYVLLMAVLMPAAGLPPQSAKASLSGVVVRAGTQEPAANVRVSLARIEKSLPPGIAALMEVSEISLDAPLEEKRIPVEMLRQTYDRMQRSGFKVPTLPVEELEFQEIVLNPNGSVAMVSGRAPPQSTGADGRFSFENLDPGAYQLSFSGREYVSRSFGQSRAGGAGEPIVLGAGQAKNDIVMPMPSAAAIEGRVLTSDGLPVAGMAVRLFRLAYGDWGRRIAYNDWGLRKRSDEDIASVETNDRGEYRMYFLPPGRYLLLAFPSWFRSIPRIASDGTVPNRVDEPCATTYYPGVTNVDAATVIELNSGADLSGINLMLIPAPLHRIRVHMPANAPDKVGLEMSTGFDSFIMRSSLIDPSDGTFEFRDVVSGAYDLVSDDRAVVTVADADLDIVWPPHYDVPVHVSFPGSGPAGASGASQTFQIKVELKLTNELVIAHGFSASWPMMKAAEAGGAPVILNGEDWFGPLEEPASVTEVGGLSVTLHLYPGPYKVSIAELPPGFYVKEARFGHDDVLNGPLRLSGFDSTPLEILIGANGGSLAGVAADGRGRPVPDAQVVLVPEQNRERSDLFKSAFAGLDGHFTITGIPPGDYKLVAWEALDRFEFFAPERLQQAVDQGQLIHIAESSQHTANVIPIPKSGDGGINSPVP